MESHNLRRYPLIVPNTIEWPGVGVRLLRPRTPTETPSNHAVRQLLSHAIERLQ